MKTIAGNAILSISGSMICRNRDLVAEFIPDIADESVQQINVSAIAFSAFQNMRQMNPKENRGTGIDGIDFLHEFPVVFFHYAVIARDGSRQPLDMGADELIQIQFVMMNGVFPEALGKPFSHVNVILTPEQMAFVPVPV